VFRLPQTVADSIHTARDATKRLCRVGSGGVNAVGEDGKTNISSERGAEPDHDEARRRPRRRRPLLTHPAAADGRAACEVGRSSITAARRRRQF